MAKKNGTTPENAAPFVPNPDVRANVSFDLQVAELDRLIDLCAQAGEFHLGIRLAEKKQNLRANVRRTDKELQALAATGA